MAVEVEAGRYRKLAAWLKSRITCPHGRLSGFFCAARIVAVPGGRPPVLECRPSGFACRSVPGYFGSLDPVKGIFRFQLIAFSTQHLLENILM